MKAGMVLATGRQTVMSPQLQRSLGQLQMSALEFAQEVNEVLASNPLLEAAEDADGADATGAEDVAQGTDAEDYPASPDLAAVEVPSEAPIEFNGGQSEWGSERPTASADGTAPDWTAVAASPRSLQAHLREQLSESRCDDSQRALCDALVDCLDDRGWLADGLDEVAASLGLGAGAMDRLTEALGIVQSLDPAGVGARSLEECLRVQLDRLPPETPYLDLARRLVDGHLVDIGHGNIRNLVRALERDEGELRDAIGLIRTLDPKPGRAFDTRRVDYVIPDLRVVKLRGRWRILLNQGSVPRVSVNEVYARAISEQSRGGEGGLLREKLREARWMIRSIEQRMSTIERVGEAIVERQQAYFDHGDIALKPMTLAEIAEDTEVHESTVCRVVNNKYMITPRGLLPLKHFFSSAVHTSAGKDCSASAVKAMIRAMVDKEPPEAPLSDHQLAHLLADKGIRIARRTVSKYRSAMGIEALEMRRVVARGRQVDAQMQH